MTWTPASLRRNCSSSAVLSKAIPVSVVDLFALALNCAMIAVHSASWASSLSVSALRLEKEEGCFDGEFSLTGIISSSSDEPEVASKTWHQLLVDLVRETIKSHANGNKEPE